MRSQEEGGGPPAPLEHRPSTGLAAEQRRIIAEEVPLSDWQNFEPFAPGLHGLVQTNRNGTIHMWAVVADEPLAGAGGRYLDSLPRDRNVRAFGVARGTLLEAMLVRRGFTRSRFPWRGLRRGMPAGVAPRSHLVRQASQRIATPR
jgi:hypothetical protein